MNGLLSKMVMIRFSLKTVRGKKTSKFSVLGIVECARTSVTSVPVKSAHYRGSVESSTQFYCQSLEPVRERTTGGQLPDRYEPAICPRALVPSKSGLWIGKPGFATYTTMYNVFYVIHHSMIMNIQQMYCKCENKWNANAI